MPFTATVYQVMIASPGDVTAEREVVREVLHEWNDLHAEEKSIVLLPLGWETHSAPSMGGSAQEIINQQVLRRSDLLIGIFWTRIGTATPAAISGTVEEIEKHVAAGKHAMIYFSDAPVAPSKLDRAQYEGVQQFRAEFEKRQRGLYASYNSPENFRDQLERHLRLTIAQHPMFVRTGSGSVAAPPPAPAAVAAEPGLSTEAQELLRASAASEQGYILRVSTLGTGVSLRVGDHTFTTPGDSRSRVFWEAGLQQLLERKLVQSVGSEGKAFQITAEGYRVADTLKPADS